MFMFYEELLGIYVKVNDYEKVYQVMMKFQEFQDSFLNVVMRERIFKFEMGY